MWIIWTNFNLKKKLDEEDYCRLFWPRGQKFLSDSMANFGLYNWTSFTWIWTLSFIQGCSFEPINGAKIWMHPENESRRRRSRIHATNESRQRGSRINYTRSKMAWISPRLSGAHHFIRSHTTAIILIIPNADQAGWDQHRIPRVSVLFRSWPWIDAIRGWRHEAALCTGWRRGFSVDTYFTHLRIIICSESQKITLILALVGVVYVSRNLSTSKTVPTQPYCTPIH
jgi:hypothetical protein